MTNKRRKYTFNWLDRLYYIGKGDDQLPFKWRQLTPFNTLIYSMLLWPVAFSIILWYPSNQLKIIYTLCIICVIISLYDWPLEKYYFTPEREQAYFRRYPQRRQISVKVMPWLPITILLTNIAILWFLIYLLR